MTRPIDRRSHRPLQNGQSLLGLLCGQGQDHADAHIVGVVHVPLRDVPGLLDQIEDGQAGEGAQVDLGVSPGSSSGAHSHRNRRR